MTDTADHKPSEDEVVSLISGVSSEFESAGVRLAIENHDRFSCETLNHILERVDSEYVGICLDTVNSFGALEGPEVVVNILGSWVVNLHVKDFVINRVNHSMGFVIEGKPAGQGRLNVPWLLQELRSRDRDPNAILELWPPPEETLEATIAKEDRWAVESIKYLRQLILD